MLPYGTLGLKSRAETARKKIDKYQDLRTELRRLWDKASGNSPHDHRGIRHLEEFRADVAPALLQKSVVLEGSNVEFRPQPFLGIEG